jgi:hypothetical protein
LPSWPSAINRRNLSLAVHDAPWWVRSVKDERLLGIALCPLSQPPCDASHPTLRSH